MTTSADTREAAPAASSGRVRGPRKGTDLGQWKVSGRTPLNHNEEFKAEENSLNVQRRIIEEYSKTGYASIPADDVHGRFRWLGLYTQRKQGVEGASTSKLDAESLSDEYFMQRIRLDGGQLSTEQARVLGEISREFARGTADVSDRQNIQLHWIRIEDVPEIWERLEAVGLTTLEACGDTPRVFLGSPVAGVEKNAIIDPSPELAALREEFIGNPEYVNLPRKFKTAITGSPTLDVVHEINDVSFVGVNHPELGPGYDLWVGGALSVAPRLGERLGAFVSRENVVPVWAGVCGIFRDYGYRKQRTKARLKFLLAEWGPEKFRQVLQDEYLGFELPDGPAPERAVGHADHVGVHEQVDGNRYVGFALTAGRLSGDALVALADAAEVAGSRRIRLTPHQKVLVLDVPEDNVNGLIEAVQPLGLHAKPSPFRRSTIACTGIEFCKLAFVETKGLAARVIDDMEQRLTDVEIPTPISLHINGCPNSCARIQTADIGLKGQYIGEEYVFQVHLGGGLASTDREEGSLGRTVRGLKVTADDLADYVERVTRTFLRERGPEQSFAEWALSAEEESLR
ncbi:MULTISPECIES: nitrite/sulfite reductase [Kocuria]|uniref:nitrite/sulfite reductase n=1 Tax=Kocuria TaxID=57493 RepID=UPI0021A405C9|nr:MULTISPECIES: nitrite/sulfite reductase [Kocuria]MCT1545118.1 nitrite/sulfite reductase [Kocuria rhizophila]MCT2171682.1 nitrite/sulfite reductase [Kocuria rhizophila]MDN3463246.1 nitrite/sulfite reductase [Kocuria sp. APC 4018]